MRPTFPPPTSIADWIKDIRDAAGLDQTAFGKTFGVSQSSVARWEAGEAVPEYPRRLALQKISDMYGLARPGRANPAEGFGSACAKTYELSEQIAELLDLLHALDKIGDGIGSADGYAVSAVALSAKSIADNVLDGLKALSRAPRATRAYACMCAREVA
ncbi:helix-turn-helix transcriptional regulator [Shinella yambaruensis]|uniref:helix-turn-helix domain-containing protein n=1 Tax=Shinella yambaruensis TaxID=415996 RepID=UPI003D78EDE3